MNRTPPTPATPAGRRSRRLSRQRPGFTRLRTALRHRMSTTHGNAAAEGEDFDPLANASGTYDVTTPDASGTGTALSAQAPAIGDDTVAACRLHSSRPVTPVPGAPVFVLVHGLGMSHRYFRRLKRELDATGETHVLDLPGFGGTPTPDRPLSVPDYADVIARAMDAARLRSCTLIGHSMGAQFVTELALQRPDLVARLILIGPVTDPAHASALSHTLSLGLDTVMEHPFTTMLAARAYARCGLPWYFRELPVMLGYRLDLRLPLVDRPVLVIRGARDPIAGRDWCARLAGSSPQGRLLEIPGQAHAAHRAGAAAVGAAIMQFGEDHPVVPEKALNHPSDGLQLRGNRRNFENQPLSEPAPVLMKQPRPASLTVGDRQCRAHVMPHRPAPTATPTGTLAEAQPVPVFVLIHGIGMSHRYFQRLGDQLSAHGQVIVLDLPGAGWTKKPTARVTNAKKAELIGVLLDGMGVSSCVVIGHSMGVQSATELALRRPALVSHLILIGAAVDARRRTVPQQALTLTANNALEKPLLNTLQFTDMLRCGPRWYLAELAVAMTYPLEERLPRAGQPVLIIRGSRDLVAGSGWSRTLAESAADGGLTEIDGAYHGVHHSAPGTVTARIMSFIAGTADRLQEPEAA